MSLEAEIFPKALPWDNPSPCLLYRGPDSYCLDPWLLFPLPSIKVSPASIQKQVSLVTLSDREEEKTSEQPCGYKTSKLLNWSKHSILDQLTLKPQDLKTSLSLKSSAITAPHLVSTTHSISAACPTKNTLSSCQGWPSSKILPTFGSS